MARSHGPAPNSSSLAGSRVTMRRDGLTWMGARSVNQKSYAVQSRAVNVVEAAAHRPTDRTVASNPMAPAWSQEELRNCRHRRAASSMDCSYRPAISSRTAFVSCLDSPFSIDLAFCKSGVTPRPLP